MPSESILILCSSDALSSDRLKINFGGSKINSELNAFFKSILPAPPASNSNSFLYSSVITSEVVTRMDFISCGVKSGFFSNSKAIAPETCGAA